MSDGAEVGMDRRITFDLDTAHTLTKTQVPQQAYSILNLTTMARSQEGLPKPLVFGTPWDTGGATLQHIIPGVGVSLDGSTSYRSYEYLDPTVPVRDVVDVDIPTGYSIKVFPNKDLAGGSRSGNGYVCNTVQDEC